MANKYISQSQTPKDILADLYNSGLLANVTIQLKDHTIRAHRAILAKTSAWFANQFTNDPEYDSKLVIKLTNDDATAMKALVCFCYTGKYSRYLRKPMLKLSSSCATACSNNLGLHINVYSTAEKYNATSLQAYSLEAFNNEGQELLRVGPSYLLPIIKRAYNLRPESCSLRSAAVRLLNQYLDSLNNSIVPTTQVYRVKKAPNEATELLIQIAKDVQAATIEAKHHWECLFCRTTFKYAGEAKDGDLKRKICPWCVAEGI